MKDLHSPLNAIKVRSGKMFDLNMLVKLDEYLKGVEELEKRYKSLERDQSLVELDQNMIRLQQALVDIIQNVKEIEYEAAEASNKLKTCTIRLDHINKTLYDGSIRDLKQMECMERELISLRSQKEELEWKELQCQESIDELIKQKSDLDEKLSVIKGKFSTRRGEVRLEASIIKNEILRLKREAEEITQNADKGILAVYYEIRAKKGSGTAVIINNICTGCNMMIATTIIDRIKMGKSIFYCETCGRIHVIPRN